MTVFPIVSPAVSFLTSSPVYTWTPLCAAALSNTAVINTTKSWTVNSISSTTMNFSFNINTSISRSGSDPGAFNYSTAATIYLKNITTGELITVYSATLYANSVVYNGTASILHANTLNISVPSNWYLIENSNWCFVFDVTNIETTTGVSSNRNFQDTTFLVDLGSTNFDNMKIRVAGVLKTPTKIWVRVNGVLREATNIKTRVNGVIK